MPLTPKPKAEHEQEREAAIEAVINKGLASPADKSAAADQDRQVVLFLPRSLLAEVDRLVKGVRPKTSRRAWLVEAIREKVEQETKRIQRAEAREE
jgi:hypothetical protein